MLGKRIWLCTHINTNIFITRFLVAIFSNTVSHLHKQLFAEWKTKTSIGVTLKYMYIHWTLTKATLGTEDSHHCREVALGIISLLNVSSDNRSTVVGCIKWIEYLTWVERVIPRCIICLLPDTVFWIIFTVYVAAESLPSHPSH